jgi:hypothetical protein
MKLVSLEKNVRLTTSALATENNESATKALETYVRVLPRALLEAAI